MKKYYQSKSMKSRFINFLFRFSKSKKIFSNESEIKKYIHKLSENRKEYCLPEKMGMYLEYDGNMRVYSYNGTLKNNNGKILLYIHGGSYIEEAIYYQIKFSMKIADKTNSTLIMPIYPLAPNGNYKDMYLHMDKLYSYILSFCDNFNFLGDSAGGGFVLSYSMYLRKNKKKQPKNIIMMSPWLDISMKNPDLRKSEKKDPTGGIDGNVYAGKLWANGLDSRNYLVSPIYGDLKSLPKITIITGEMDILKPDCLLLSHKLTKINIEHNYIEYAGQGHDFGAYPTKEGKMVIDDIAIIINRGDIYGK